MWGKYLISKSVPVHIGVNLQPHVHLDLHVLGKPSSLHTYPKWVNLEVDIIIIKVCSLLDGNKKTVLRRIQI